MNVPDKLNQKQTLRSRGICVVIPTYNNAGTITDVVTRALNCCDDVIVVNDGSTDGTLELLQRFECITLLTYAQNKGKGYALKTGFRKALAMGFAYAITLDADGQHFPEDISILLAENKKTPGALIVGERQLKGVDRTAGSSFANKFSNFWFFVQTGVWLSDTQTGYRLYPLKKLKGLSFLTARYEAELELLVFASWHGVKVVSTPVNVFYPSREERVSHFRPAADFARISVLNTVLCLLAVVYGLPLRVFRFSGVALRTIYSLLFFVLTTTLILLPLVKLYLIIGKMTEKKRMSLHKLLWKSARFIMLWHKIPGTKFAYSLSENANLDKPSVVICNHQSHLDLTCLLIFNPKIIFLTKNWVWNNPFYGLLIRNAEYLSVENGYESIIPQLKSLAERGYSIAVFPEGTRSADCSISRFHKGAFYIARELKLDIVPMFLYGTGRVLPKNGCYLHKGLMTVEVEERIPYEEHVEMGDTRALTSVMHRYYVNRYAEICNKFDKDA